MHLGVLTLVVTNRPGVSPSGRCQGYSYRYSYGKKAKKHYNYKVFCNSSSKNKGKPTVFQHFQQNIAKSTAFVRFSSTLDEKTKENQWFFNIFSKILQKALVFQCFLQSEFKKQRKTNGFSLFSAKYCKKHRFYKVFEHSGCKNQGKPMVIQYVQQNVAKNIA